LAERLHEFSRPALPSAANLSARPAAYAALESNFWTSLFEISDPGATGIFMETRHPFFDVRLLSWLLALPPIPWSLDKYLLRLAMRGHLPDPVRLRPKAPLAVNPGVALARRNGLSNFNQLAFTEEVMQYVSPEEFFPIDTGGDEDTMFRKFRAISLQFWLQSSGHLKYKKALGGI
jgi:asparagine synthase (glutamine-hydrolysing)